MEYIITVTDSLTREVVDAEESRDLEHARRVFDARVEQWRDSGETVTVCLVNDRGTIIQDNEIN